MVQALVNLENALSEADEASDKQTARIRAAHKAATFAQREFDSGFTLLHAHGVVLLWSALETMVFDLCIASLRNVPHLLEAESFQRQRIPLVQFAALDEDERLEFLVLAADRDASGQAAQGISRLEALLRLVGLEGEMDDPSLRNDLHTLHQIRNLVAHRRGIVDRQFLTRCRPVGGVLGQRLPIDAHMFINLQLVAIHYVYVVFNRCCHLYGGKRRVWNLGPSKIG